jgi:hypothetical protein
MPRSYPRGFVLCAHPPVLEAQRPRYLQREGSFGNAHHARWRAVLDVQIAAADDQLDARHLSALLGCARGTDRLQAHPQAQGARRCFRSWWICELRSVPSICLLAPRPPQPKGRPHWAELQGSNLNIQSSDLAVPMASTRRRTHSADYASTESGCGRRQVRSHPALTTLPRSSSWSQPRSDAANALASGAGALRRHKTHIPLALYSRSHNDGP